MPRVLISAKLEQEGVKLIRAVPGIEVVESEPLNGDALVEALRGVQGLIVRSETKVKADVLEKTPDLKVIGRAGTGFDNIDAKAAAARGIAVLIAPGGNTVTTAEHTLEIKGDQHDHIPKKLRGWIASLIPRPHTRETVKPRRALGHDHPRSVGRFRGL